MKEGRIPKSKKKTRRINQKLIKLIKGKRENRVEGKQRQMRNFSEETLT